ncbi:MAG: nucleotidyl transferase AbiEii/AbiGii toxin family protein [Clostridia bacterium]
MYWNTIDKFRKLVLKKIVESFPLDDYYMAGRTGISLQCGCRMSYDFDFFTPFKFDSSNLSHHLSKLGDFKVIYEKGSTLHGILDGINITFLYYPNPMLKEYVFDDEIEGLKYASLMDIAVMKLVALSSRGAKKDYYDLCYMAKYQDINLVDAFYLLDKKFIDKNINEIHMLQSLTYFDDAEKEADLDMIEIISWKDIKQFFINLQKEIYSVYNK